MASKHDRAARNDSKGQTKPAAPQVGAVHRRANDLRASVIRDSERLLAATQVWQGLTHAEKLQLARETSEARSEELRRAYRDLVGIGYGFKATGEERGRVTTEPCVTFLVRRKWMASEAIRRRKTKLPQYLYSWHTVNGARRLCAIPTDVEGGQSYVAVRPHANAMVRASADGVGGASGMICCAVQFQGSGPIYGLGCHHVLALSEVVADIPDAGVNVTTRSDPVTDVGQLSDHHAIVGTGRLFVDAALVPITDLAVLERVVMEPSADALIVSDQVAETVDIHTVLSGIVPATLRAVWNNSDSLIPYDVLAAKFGGPIVSKTIVEVVLDLNTGMTQPGDSGSPVFNSGGSIFQGMYIAGGGTQAFFIPAWELLRASNYGFTSGQDVLSLAFLPR